MRHWLVKEPFDASDYIFELMVYTATSRPPLWLASGWVSRHLTVVSAHLNFVRTKGGGHAPMTSAMGGHYAY